MEIHTVTQSSMIMVQYIMLPVMGTVALNSSFLMTVQRSLKSGVTKVLTVSWEV